MTQISPELMHVLQHDDLDKLREYFGNGFLMDSGHTFTSPEGKRYNDTSLLFAAVEFGATKIATWLVEEAHCDPTKEENWCSSALHSAAGQGLNSLIRLMINHGADPDTELDGGETPLLRAAGKGQLSTFLLLLELGAASNNTSRPPLYLLGNFNTTISYTAALISAGAYVHAKNFNNIEYRLTHSPEMNRYMIAHLDHMKSQLACEEGDGMSRTRLLDYDNRLTAFMHRILGADMLDDLFSCKRWCGKEKQAVELYEDMLPLIPQYYKWSYRNFDLTSLREKAVDNDKDAPSMQRYVRNRTSGERVP